MTPSEGLFADPSFNGVNDRFAPEAADQNGRLDEIRDQDGFDALVFGSL